MSPLFNADDQFALLIAQHIAKIAMTPLIE